MDTLEREGSKELGVMSFGEILLGWTGKSYDSKRCTLRRLSKDEIQAVFGYGVMPKSEVWKSFVRQVSILTTKS